MSGMQGHFRRSIWPLPRVDGTGLTPVSCAGIYPLVGKHALPPGAPQARAFRRERFRLAAGHALLVIPILCPVEVARYAASQADSAGRVGLWALATVAAGVIVAGANAASKRLAARRSLPRSSWQYLLAAGACALVAAACTGMLVKLANARSEDGYEYIPLMSAGLESLAAALILAGRSLSRGQAGRHLWLWLHLPAYLTGPDQGR
jgi:hypothetical protein